MKKTRTNQVAEINHRFVEEIREHNVRTGQPGYVTVGARSLYEAAVNAGLLVIERTEMGCHRLRAI